MKKGVWKVTAYNVDDRMGWDTDGNWVQQAAGTKNIFEDYFTNKDKADEVYHKGVREYGPAAGYTKMRWTLEGFYVDDNAHIEQMFNDVREAMGG